MGTVVSTGFVRGLMDKWPLADDSYWLGSTDKGWKGVYFPDLKLYQYDATTLSIGTITGGSFLDISGDGTKVTLLPATGVYLRIGDAGTTSHVLNTNDDFLVTGAFECDGIAYLDGAVKTYADVSIGSSITVVSTRYIQAGSTDGDYFMIKAKDGAVGNVEIARVVGAADPYFQIGRSDTGVSTSTTTDHFYLQAGAGANNVSAGFGLGVPVYLSNGAHEVEERGSLDWVLETATNGAEDASLVVRLQDGGTVGDVATFKGSDKSFNIGTAFNLKRFYSIVTLATDGATTTVGLTPGAVIMAAAIRVSTAIAGLDEADHHIQLGIVGTTDKYVDVANGSAATSIAKNVKGHYTFDPTTDTEAAALILTITGGADQTPSAGAVEVEVIYLAASDLANT